MTQSTIEAWKKEEYPLWHGSSSMSSILRAAGPNEMFVRGEGVWLTDKAGRKLLDARAGVANMMLGYGRADIIEAMHRQAQDLAFSCTMRYEHAVPVVVDCAAALRDATGGKLTKVRFCHTGNSAVEAALLMARQYQRNLGRPEKVQTVAFNEAYHGCGLMPMAASGLPGLHALFGPMPEGFHHVDPPNPQECPLCLGRPGGGRSCVDTMLEKLESVGPDKVAAVLIEPVKGLSAHAVPAHYLQTLREFCSKHGILLIFDEVFSGYGRVGPMFAAEISGVWPDVMCLSKGMTAGYSPLAALLTTEAVFDAFDGPGRIYFIHGSSTDAHPVACAAGLATLRAYQREQVVERGSRMGARLHANLEGQVAGLRNVARVRALGAYVAVEVLDEQGKKASMPQLHELRVECENRGVLVDYTPEILMLVPPLVLGDADADLVADVVASVLRDAAQRSAGKAGAA